MLMEVIGTQDLEKVSMLDMAERGTSSESKIRLVSPAMLPFIWEEVLEVMREHPRGLLDGWFTEQEVYQALFTNRYDLWVALSDLEESKIEAVALARLEPYTEFSIYRIMWCGGKVKKHLDDVMKQFNLYATDVLKADKLAFDGRLGFIRTHSKYGFEVVRFEMWKSLGKVN
jgi:hypothetical protein